MDLSRVNRLHDDGKLTEKQRDTLLALLQRGVTDPCSDERATAAECRLWYTHLPKASGKLTGAIDDVHQVLLQQKDELQRALHYELRRNRFNRMLDTYLHEWWGVTRDRALLAAVVWSWLNASGNLDAANVESKSMPLAKARTDPADLICLLSVVKREFHLRFSPYVKVDELALKEGWWTEDAPQRTDAFVLAGVEEALEEDEWVPVEDVAARIGKTDEEVREAMARLPTRLSAVGKDGVTHAAICNVARTVRARVEDLCDLAPLPTEVEGLNDEQAAVCRQVLQGKALTLCCSPAGTGKTHTAAALAKVPAFTTWVEKWRTVKGDKVRETVLRGVVCLAPTHKALSVLRGKIGTHDRTFLTVQRLPYLDEPPPATLVIVDEISMLTMGQVATILRVYGGVARLLFLGDDAQLPCIGRGAPVRDLQRLVPTLRLTRCMRTEGVALVRVATSVRDEGVLGDVGEGGEVEVRPLEDDGDVTTAASLLAVPQTPPAAPWAASYVQIITSQNKHRDAINEAVQARTTAGGRCFSKCYVGDAVRFHVNDDLYKNGDEGVLTAIDQKRGRDGKDKSVGTVQLKNGSAVQVEQNHILPAYACTVHKAQGSEYGHVVLALFHGANRKMCTREMVYTSVTRARERLTALGYTAPLQRPLPTSERRTVLPHL